MLQLNDDLVQRFGELLNEFDPQVKAEADKGAGLTVTLHFDASKVETARMRELATLVADHVA